MIKEFEITSSKGQVCIYKDYTYIYEEKNYSSLWEAKYKAGFSYDIDNPFYIVRWKYNQEAIELKIKGLGADFKIDPISKLLIIKGNFFEAKVSNKIISNFDFSINKLICYFLKENGSIDHKLILPEYVFYEKDIPWNTFLSVSSSNKKNIKIISVEEFFNIGFDKERNSLVGSYYYMHDSVQEREYDAINREWGAIVSAWKS